MNSKKQKIREKSPVSDSSQVNELNQNQKHLFSGVQPQRELLGTSMKGCLFLMVTTTVSSHIESLYSELRCLVSRASCCWKRLDMGI